MACRTDFPQMFANLVGVGSGGGELQVGLILLAGACQLPGALESHREVVMGVGNLRMQADSFFAFVNRTRQVVLGLQSICQIQVGARFLRPQPEVFAITRNGFIKIS